MSDILLYENPYDFSGMGFEMNPRKKSKSRKRRNPTMKKTVENAISFKGVKVQDILGSLIGFTASAMVPGYIIKPSVENPELSMWAKGGKIALSLVFAVLMKGVGDAVSPGMGKSAMYGGFAGTGALALKEFAPTSWPNVINGPVGVNGRRVARQLPARSVSPPSPPSVARNTNDEFVPANAL